jgi:glycosyltransferase involved in cell wall biosynthesis
MSLPATDAALPLLIIAVPTCRRPRMLACCLESLGRLERPPGLRIELLVVDNDPAGSARPVVADYRGDLPLHHVIEAERGLSSVRNRILAECQSRGAAWLAGIDDDEFALPDWLRVLWDARQRHGADIVTGPVPRLPWGAAVDADDLRRRARDERADGHVPRRIASGNALLRLAALGEPPLGFAAGLNLAGGEDHDFFERLRARGARAVWAAGAVAVEWLPPERQRLNYRLWRHYSDGVAAVARARMQRQPAWRLWPHYGLKATGKLGGGLLALLGLPFGPRRAGLAVAVRVANACGYLAGLCGARAERYRHTDGF